MLQFQTMGVVSDAKVNILGALYSFKKNRGKQKKNDGKTGIFTQNQFLTKSIFLYDYNSKTNNSKYIKFLPNVYVSIIYIQLNFQKLLTFFDVNKKILDDQKHLKI
ncbi:Uncharacterized protein FWK35_00011776 [Aphis craccivora]|uniref:Uncharacterized protein n=1 Tax=Aphis craccivora TaxID=307492 RepID=A0A6G0YR02_APHCR|nr:Uncharacterized protein FWK35_00011776 [Aphis craccivora]